MAFNLKKKCKLFLLLACLFTVKTGLTESSEIYPFKKPEDKQRFHTLNKNLRCLVCQNQDLADSHAPLANDLRQEIYQQILIGKTDKEILAYLTSRYGDFILFKPAIKPETYLLWFAPGVFVLFGIILLLKNCRGSLRRVKGEAPKKVLAQDPNQT